MTCKGNSSMFQKGYYAKHNLTTKQNKIKTLYTKRNYPESW